MMRRSTTHVRASIAVAVGLALTAVTGGGSAQAYAPTPGVMYAPSQAERLEVNKAHAVLYPKAASTPSGRLVASFERSIGDPVGQTLPVYKSDDYGTSWQRLTELRSPAAMTAGTPREADFAKYSSNWTNPYLYVMPEDVGDIKKGTLLLASVVSGDDVYFKEQKAANPNWRPSRDGDRKDVAIALYADASATGESWTFLNIIAKGSWSGSYGSLASAENTFKQNDPVWEPFLMVHNGQLVVYYSDENEYSGYDPDTGLLQADPNNDTAPDPVTQILVHKTWNGVARTDWSAPVVDVADKVAGSGSEGRPGMTTVVPTTDGKWLLTYEQGSAKISEDPLRFWDKPRVALLDGAGRSIHDGGSPVLITVPKPDGSWKIVFNNDQGSNGTDVWVNESGSSTGIWSRYATTVGQGYSRNLTYVPQTGRVVILRGNFGDANPIEYGEVDLGHSEGAYYTLVNRATGQVLSTVQDKTQDPPFTGDQPDIITWSNNPVNDTQRWHVQPKGESVTFLNKGGGRSLAIWQGKASSSQPLTQWVDNNDSDKLWNLVPTTDGYVKVQSAKNTALFVSGNGPGGQVRLAARVDGTSSPAADDAQEWQLVQEGPGGGVLNEAHRSQSLIAASSISAGTSLRLDAATPDPANNKTHANISGRVWVVSGSNPPRDLGTVAFDANEVGSITVPASFGAAEGVKIVVQFDSSAAIWDFVNVTDVAVAPKLLLGAEATTRTVAGKVYLSVSAVNRDTVPVDVAIATAYGNKTFKAVAPGKSVAVSFNSRLTSIPAGAATVTATGTKDGKSVTEVKSASYAAFSVTP